MDGWWKGGKKNKGARGGLERVGGSCRWTYKGVTGHMEVLGKEMKVKEVAFSRVRERRGARSHIRSRGGM